jgi:hypothetical protein|tara:strand:+ start:409 stop:525 length:117 start_codon:yes stop_codon:yes gene_type:complete
MQDSWAGEGWNSPGWHGDCEVFCKPSTKKPGDASVQFA